MISELETIEAYRKSTEGLAYRMLGSWADAQDVAQDSLLKWHRLAESSRSKIDNPKAWLHKVASRLCLDRLKSARRAREHYIGPWLPEPLLIHDESPADLAAEDDSVTIALLLAMERLTPAERAAFLLHDIFAYSFDEIAAILNKSSSNCRQLASRARSSIRSERRKFEFDPKQHRQLLEAFAKAASHGDDQSLKRLLAEDVELHSDGGGLAPAARKILKTREIVTRLYVGLSRKRQKSGSQLTHAITTLNGQPGLLVYHDGALETAISLSVSNNRIHRIYQQRNPEKLRTLAKRLNPAGSN